MKIYSFFAEGFEETEAVSVIDLLRRANIEAITVSISDNYEVSGNHKIKLICDALILDSDFTDGSALFFPGGVPGVPNLAKCKKIIDLINLYFNRGDYVAAICAAPYLFDIAGILDNKKFTCFPSWKEKIKTGEYLDLPVICDGKIITGRSMGSSINFGLKIIECLKGNTVAEKIKNDIIT